MNKQQLLNQKYDADYWLMNGRTERGEYITISKNDVVYSVRKYIDGPPNEKPYTRDKEGLFKIIHYSHWSGHYTNWQDQGYFKEDGTWVINRKDEGG